MLRLLLKLALLLTLPATASAQDTDRLRALAEQGSGPAQYALGTIYANGDGPSVDYRQAAHWFELAARRGHVEARRQLVFMRQLGLIEGMTMPALTGGGAFRIQVATVPSEPDAAREWRRLQRRHPAELGALEMVAVPFDPADGTTLYRLQGGPLDEEGAHAACGRLREEGTTCLVLLP